MLTAAQATAQVEELIHSSLKPLTPQPRLERSPSPGLDYVNCLDPSDGGSPDRVVISHAYWLRDIPALSYTQIATQLRDEWRRQGFKIVVEQNFDTGHPQIQAEHAGDGFVLNLDRSKKNALLISATSPCLWPDGTPGHVFHDENNAPVPPGTPGAVMKTVPTS